MNTNSNFVESNFLATIVNYILVIVVHVVLQIAENHREYSAIIYT